jgi:hypothetical protein
MNTVRPAASAQAIPGKAANDSIANPVFPDSQVLPGAPGAASAYWIADQDSAMMSVMMPFNVQTVTKALNDSG